MLITACKKESPGPVTTNTDTTQYIQGTSGVFIVNEGNYFGNNGSLSYINFETNEISNDIFQNKNHRTLGDVALTMQSINKKAYIIVNNSAKIEVVDIENMNSIATIFGFISPRHFIRVNSTKAYVSELYSDSIKIVDLVSNQISGYINIHRSSESMVIYGSNLFVANWSNYSKPSVNNDYVMIIDVLNDQLIDSIHVSKEPNSLIIDKNNKIWVLCSGGYDNSESPALIRINPDSRTIEQTFVFSDINSSPYNLSTNLAKDSLFFINNDIFSLSVSSLTLPISPIITSGSQNFYSIAINPQNSQIFISDALDYNQNGKIFIYSGSGNLVKTYTAGIIPGNVCFN